MSDSFINFSAVGQWTPGALSGADTRTQKSTTATVFDSNYATVDGVTYSRVDAVDPFVGLSNAFAVKASTSGISVSQNSTGATEVTDDAPLPIYAYNAQGESLGRIGYDTPAPTAYQQSGGFSGAAVMALLLGAAFLLK